MQMSLKTIMSTQTYIRKHVYSCMEMYASKNKERIIPRAHFLLPITTQTQTTHLHM